MKYFKKILIALLFLPTLVSAAPITNSLLWWNGTNFNGTSTSPLYVSSIVGTTTATSTFGGGINLTGGCFAVSGTCLSLGGGATGTSTATTSGLLTSTDWNTFWNGLFPRGGGSIAQTASTSPTFMFATSTYLFDDFGAFSSRWRRTGSGAMTITQGTNSAPSYLSITTPASADTLATRTLWTNILRGYDTMEFDVNFNGYTFLTAADTPRLGFEQSGAKWIVLTDFATNGVDGWQHVSVPLARFTSDGTSGGTPLAPGTTVTNFQLRAFDNVAGRVLSIRNVVLSDSTHTLYQDFTQPDLFSKPKPGNALWRIQSVDVMKVSKDNVTSQYTNAQMDALLVALKPLNLTHIAIDVPRDNCGAYSPVVACGYDIRWAEAVRRAGYNVFWRQQWNSWEGNYGGSGFGKATTTGVTTMSGVTPVYSPTGGIALGTAANVLNGSDTTSRLALTYRDYINNYKRYAPGDIITPVAEPENGGIVGGTTCYPTGDSPPTSGNQYCQFADKNTFNTFLEDSITIANAAMKQIGLGGRVHIGFYGSSENIVNGTGGGTPYIDERLADAMQIITMDDYTNPASDLATDLATYQGRWSQNRPLIITEFGTINDTSTSTRISTLETYLGIMKSKSYVQGFNYWVANGGADENLLNSNLQPVGAFGVLQNYYTGGAPALPASCLQSLWLGNCVSTASSSPPTVGQVLTALSTSTAAWAAPASTVSSGILGQLGWYAASGTTISGTSTQLTIGNLLSTTTATSTFRGAVGIGTTTPNAFFSIVSALASTTEASGSATSPWCKTVYTTPSGKAARIYLDDTAVLHTELGACQ